MTEDLILSPCPYMRSAMERLARGERGCLWLWYAQLHAIRCPRCRKALLALKNYFAILKKEPQSGEGAVDWTRLESTLDSIDDGWQHPLP